MGLVGNRCLVVWVSLVLLFNVVVCSVVVGGCSRWLVKLCVSSFSMFLVGLLLVSCCWVFFSIFVCVVLL